MAVVRQKGQLILERRLNRSPELFPPRGAVGRVLAVDPRALELLIVRRLQQAPLVAGVPPQDVVRLAALLRPLLPALRPAGVGVARLALLLVPEQRPALAVALDAQGHRRERRRPQLRRAERVALVVAGARQEVLPQGVRVVALEPAGDELALLLDLAGRPLGRVADVLRQHGVA